MDGSTAASGGSAWSGTRMFRPLVGPVGNPETALVRCAVFPCWLYALPYPRLLAVSSLWCSRSLGAKGPSCLLSRPHLPPPSLAPSPPRPHPHLTSTPPRCYSLLRPGCRSPFVHRTRPAAIHSLTQLLAIIPFFLRRVPGPPPNIQAATFQRRQHPHSLQPL